MLFHKGQKVLCVDDSVDCAVGQFINGWLVSSVSLDGLTKNAIYTIRGYAGPSWLDNITHTYWLEEIHRPINQRTFLEFGYKVTRFRPLIERKTDISVFQQLLNPTNHRFFEGV